MPHPFFPGSRIGLEPPGDMKVSTRLPGFEDTERKAVMAILDLPGSAYRELETAAFSKTQRELQDAKRESFPFENGIGFLISGTAQQNGVTVHRWSLLALAVGSVQNLTMLINVEVPEAALSLYSDAVIRKALASVTFRPAPIQEQLGLMPFSFRDLAGFQVMQVLPTGSVILGEEKSDNSEAQPFMIVSVERNGPAAAADRSLFVRSHHEHRQRAQNQEVDIPSGTLLELLVWHHVISHAKCFPKMTGCERAEREPERRRMRELAAQLVTE